MVGDTYQYGIHMGAGRPHQPHYPPRNTTRRSKHRAYPFAEALELAFLAEGQAVIDGSVEPELRAEARFQALCACNNG
jgi:hypothetical protein